MKPITRFCRRRKVHFWGQEHFVTPRLVDWIHGDGLQIVMFQPLATRPNYYVVRVDSKIDLCNWNKGPIFCDEVLDHLRNEIEHQYLPYCEEWEHQNGRTYVKHWDFPALNYSCGSAWDLIAVLKEPDARTERRVRADLRRAQPT